ncbi:putative baseplate assembly protein [Nocardioides ginsengisoli]|uniref:Baseplate assembly protein n=1 Tax=Nocardioides ginsengisoli TaxID=363868 RepID=A0ABW3W0S1_9ACTN
MPLRTPVLDDRSYAQLRDELVARIPVFAPEWTDHNPSDPGITLLELFAFLGENLLYRFNQIPDATKVAFLDLLGIPMLPATPATGLVRFETKEPAGVLVEQHTRVLAGDVPFQTLREVTAWPIGARAAIRMPVTEELDRETLEYVGRAAAAVGASTTEIRAYRTSWGAYEPMKPGGDVLDPATSIDGTLYVALTSALPDLTALAGGRVTLGFVPESDVPTMQVRALDPCAGEGQAPPSPPMEWQVATVVPVAGAADPATADPIWRALDVVGDTTAGLTGPGVVELRLPADLSDIGVYVPADPEALGAGDQPPLVEDTELQRTIVAWLRVFRPGGGAIPAAESVVVNAAAVEQSVTSTAEFLGVGTGEPGQTRSLVHAGVLGDVVVDVEEQGRWVTWEHVDDFRASGIDDRHVVVDRESGAVSCGDGRRGRVWQVGERIRVRSYRSGGGAAGNVGPLAIKAAPDCPKATVVNDLPMRGGADAERLPDAMARIPAEFRTRDRAVTASDFRELAERAGVARAEVLPLFHPLTPHETAPGVVSVVVWPRVDVAHPTAPRPDRVLLDQVCRYLDCRRLVTTELHVIPPTYRRIAVSVGVTVLPGHGAEAVRRWVERVLRQLLAPLPPYGPAGRGWPLGRRVFAPELEAAALQVEGVEYLTPSPMPGSGCLVGIRLAEETAPGVWSEPLSRSIDLEAWEVPELVAVTVVQGEALPPGQVVDPPTPTGPAVPVRSPLEVC